jgi:hypothetical protein
LEQRTESLLIGRHGMEGSDCRRHRGNLSVDPERGRGAAGHTISSISHPSRAGLSGFAVRSVAVRVLLGNLAVMTN